MDLSELLLRVMKFFVPITFLKTVSCIPHLITLYLFLLFLNFLFTFSIKVYIQYCISFRCPAQWLDIYTVYEALPPIILAPPGTIHSYYNVSDCVPHAVLYLFHNFWLSSLDWWYYFLCRGLQLTSLPDWVLHSLSILLPCLSPRSSFRNHFTDIRLRGLPAF